MTSQNTSTSISEIYTSRKVLLQLMSKQDYVVSEYENFSINEINSMNQNKQLDLCLKKKDPDPITNQKQKIYIHYYLAKNITLNHIEENIEDLFNIEQVLTKNNTLVLIIKDDINETLTNELKHIWEKDGIFIIAIPIKRLQFNILNHQLQPKIRVMEPQEVLDIQKKFNIKNLAEFPKISRFDPLAQAICIRPNQVCEIIRSSKTSITSLYYRVCVNV